ncbi:hypothetical protein FQZ97_812600 [compost metagenome]
MLLSLYCCGSGRYRRLGSRLSRAAFIYKGLADRVAADKFAAAIMGLGRQIHLGYGRASLGFGLSNQSTLKLGLRIDIGQASLGSADIGHGLRKPCPVVPIVDPEQDVAHPNGLVVLDLYRSDVACNLCGERGDVAADISVVGRGRAARTSHGPSGRHDHQGADAQQYADQLSLVLPCRYDTDLGACAGGNGSLVLERFHVLVSS